MNSTVLQLHGQKFEHDEAFIVGTREELRKLSFLIVEAGDSTSGYRSGRFFSSDGEGYTIHAIRVTPEEAKRLAHQYTDGVDRGSTPQTLSVYDILDSKRK